MTNCTERAARDAMTDAEFWEHVFHPDGRPIDDLTDDGDTPPCTVGSCIRCGEPIEADDYEAAAALVDADVELCEVCADEVTEELP